MINFEQYVIYGSSFFCGIGLIIFAMQKLSVGIQSFLSSLIKYFLNAMTTNSIVSFVFGTLIAFSIQSGTSVATMALSYSNSGLIRLRQLYMLLLGSNLGTVLTVFLFVVDFGNLDIYLIAVGFFPMIYLHWPRLQSLGRIIFSIGLLILGQKFMLNHATIDGFGLLQNVGFGITFESSFISTWLIILLVVLVSLFFRSTVALLVGTMSLLATQNMSVLTAAIVVLSINLGKAVPALQLARQRNLVAKKGALFHFGIHFSLLLLSSFFIPEIIQGINNLYSIFGTFKQPNSFLFVALLHLTYNLVVVLFGAIVLYPFGLLIEKIFQKSKIKENQKLIFIGSTSHMSPSLALEQVFQEIKKMAATIETILQQTAADLSEDDNEAKVKILKYEKITDNIQIEIYDFLDKVMEVPLTSMQGRQIRILSRLTDELEHIADGCKSISLCKKEILQLGGIVYGEFMSALEKSFDNLLSLYEMVFFELTDQESYSVDEYRKRLTKFEQKHIDLRKDYVDWLNRHALSSYEAGVGVQIGDILFNIKKIYAHSVNIHKLRTQKVTNLL